MEVLDLKPIKNKNITINLIENGNPLWSKYEEMNFENLLETNNFKFITMDSEFEENDGATHTGILNLLKKCVKNVYTLDIPEYAKGYLLEEISRQREQVEELEAEYKLISKNEEEINSAKALNLKTWIDYLRIEVQEKEDFLNLEVRPQWVSKGLLDLINLYEDTNLHIIHLTTKELLPKIKKILEELNVKVIYYDIGTKILAPEQIIRG